MACEADGVLALWAASGAVRLAAIVVRVAAEPITPHVVVQGAERAVAFYRDAFGAEELSRIP